METPIIVIGVTILLIVFIFVMWFRTAGKPDLNAAIKEDEDRKKAQDDAQKEKPLEDAKIKEDKVVNDAETEEVFIPEHCKVKQELTESVNKYFFNVHEYISLSGKKMFCIVCSACIKGHNYRIVLKNSYYPYLTSYTEKVYEKYINMFKDEHMSYEEFKNYGSENFDRVGKIIDSLFNLVY